MEEISGRGAWYAPYKSDDPSTMIHNQSSIINGTFHCVACAEGWGGSFGSGRMGGAWRQ